MTKLELLRKLHDEINAIGGEASNAFDRGLNAAVIEALNIIEREMDSERANSNPVDA